MHTWEERQSYVTTLVTKVNIKQKKIAEGSRHHSSLSYQLKIQDGASVKGCKALFSSTLGLPERTITHWLNKDTNEQAAALPCKSGLKQGKHSKLETDVKDFLKDWFRDLPTVDSHYCRNTDTYKDKKFLHHGTTISQLHWECQQPATIAGVRADGIWIFHSVP